MKCMEDTEYIPWNMGTILLSFVFGGYISKLWIYLINLPISFRVASLALGQSYDCPSASEVTLKDVGHIDHFKPQQKENFANILWDILWPIQMTQTSGLLAC